MADYLLQIVERFGYIGIFLATTVESMFLPLPAEITMIPAGMLAAQGVMNYWGVLASGVLGILLGSWINYWIGLHLGRTLLLRFGKYVFIKPEFLAKTEGFFTRYGKLAVFIGRLLPGVKHYIAFVAGIARMKMRPFILYTGLGGIIWTWILLQIGFMAERNYERGNSTVSTLEIIIIALTLVTFLAWYLKEKMMHH
ncbi:MAG: hypothetical protein K0R63_897 [Rickettsiales bacterium]|nr:hypothetical protein [Rickettsiales bacterium]